MSTDENLFRGHFNAQQATELMAELRKSPNFNAARFDKNHPLHDAMVNRQYWLQEIISGVPAPEGATPAPAPRPGYIIPQQRIMEAYKDPAIFDKGASGHGAAVAKLTAANEELAAPPLPSGTFSAR